MADPEIAEEGAEPEWYRPFRLGDPVPDGWEPVGRPVLIGGTYWVGYFVWTGEGEP